MKITHILFYTPKTLLTPKITAIYFPPATPHKVVCFSLDASLDTSTHRHTVPDHRWIAATADK